MIDMRTLEPDQKIGETHLSEPLIPCSLFPTAILDSPPWTTELRNSLFLPVGTPTAANANPESGRISYSFLAHDAPTSVTVSVLQLGSTDKFSMISSLPSTFGCGGGYVLQSRDSPFILPSPKPLVVNPGLFAG
jgi:hypothetical protein